MPASRIIVWFRRDLRLHDNEALYQAVLSSKYIIPVYIFDEYELIEDSGFGFSKAGPHRIQFLLESVAELRRNLQSIGSDLIIRQGLPEEEIFHLVKQLNVDGVYANMERTPDELRAQNNLESNLWKIGVEMRFFRGKMLFHTQDLPFPISHTPNSFVSFRKEVERIVLVRKPFNKPDKLNAIPSAVEKGDLPTLEDFGYQGSGIVGQRFKGGEHHALTRIREFLSDYDSNSYKNAKKNLQAFMLSSNLSPWLSLGCISPKLIYSKMCAAGFDLDKGHSMYDFYIDLLYRDYYRLIGKKYKDKIFKYGGITGSEKDKLKFDQDMFKSWYEANTASPLLNAIMTELNYTGYISYKARLFASNYLIQRLGISWIMGATYFQHMLIDYDVCSNWVNWNTIAGLSFDVRDNKQINLEIAEKRLDKKQTYVSKWFGSN